MSAIVRSSVLGQFVKRALCALSIYSPVVVGFITNSHCDRSGLVVGFIKYISWIVKAQAFEPNESQMPVHFWQTAYDEPYRFDRKKNAVGCC